MPNKEKVLAARLTLAAVLASGALVGAAVYQVHVFDREYYSHMEMAEDAGTPAELVERLEDARDGLSDLGYGEDGQYAYVFKTPRTNATEQRELLDSHVRQARNIREASGTSASVKFLDYRERLMENKPGVNLYDWWWHQLPAPLALLFSPAAVFVAVLGGLFSTVLFVGFMRDMASEGSAWAALVKGA